MDRPRDCPQQDLSFGLAPPREARARTYILLGRPAAYSILRGWRGIPVSWILFSKEPKGGTYVLLGRPAAPYVLMELDSFLRTCHEPRTLVSKTAHDGGASLGAMSVSKGSIWLSVCSAVSGCAERLYEKV